MHVSTQPSDFISNNLPILMGLYEKTYRVGRTIVIAFAYWDGKRWYMSHTDKEKAMRYYEKKMYGRHDYPWRGPFSEAGFDLVVKSECKWR